MRGPRLAATWIAVVALLSLLTIGLMASGGTRRADALVMDGLTVWRAPNPDPDIIIVAIDQPSLTAIGRWPWPRTTHAQMIDRLNAAGAKAIVYDVLFVDPGEGDGVLASAMAARPGVYLPMLVQQPGSNGRAMDLVPVLPELAAAARGVGAAPILFDDDGVVRRAALSITDRGEAIPHMMELLYRDANGGNASSFHSRAGDEDRNGVAMRTGILPLARSGSYPSVPFSAVLAGEVPPAFFKDKIVLVGATAEGMGDTYPVAWSAGSIMPGVEIQANLYSALDGGGLVKSVPLPLAILLSILPGILLMTGFWYLRPRAAIRLAIAVMIGWIALVALFFVVGGWWLPPVPALAGLLIAYPLWGWRRLEALSNWVGGELKQMTGELGGVFPLTSPRTTDRVGAEADALSVAITSLKSERRFTRDVLEGSPDALLVEGVDGRIGYANEAADQLFGQSVEGHQANSLAGGQDFEAGDLALPNHIVSIGVSDFDDAQGERRGRIVRLADVTAARQAEAEREAVLQFLSHDMRAPQSAILALLDSQEGRQLPPEIRERLSRNARHTLDLADGFVRLARAQSAPMVESQFDMADLMREAADTLWSQARAANVTLSVSNAKERFAHGDPALLMRALINLISNAIKYSPSGETIEVALLTGSAGPGWRVSDRGPGFREGAEDFTPFATGKSAGEQRDGIGLGLAFVETVAARHGGALTISKRKGGGSEVRVTISRERLQAL